MSDLDISGTVTITGAGEAAKDLNAAAGAATKLATETKKVDTVSKSAADKIGAVGSAAGALGSAVGMVNPQLGSMISGMGNVAGAATGMATAARAAGLTMSTAFGPVGIAIAAVTGLVAAGAIAWMDYKDKQKETAESIRATIIPALDDIISRLEREKSLRENKARLTRGEGTAIEQQAFVEEGEAYYGLARTRRIALGADAERARRGLAASIVHGDQVRINEARAVIAREERARAEEDRAEAALTTRRGLINIARERESAAAAAARNVEAKGKPNPKDPPTRTGGGGRSRAARAAEEAAQEARRALEAEERAEEERARLLEQQAQEEQDFQEGIERAAERRRQENADQQLEDARDLARDLRENAKQLTKDLEDDEKERVENAKKAAEERRDIITAVEGAIVQSIDMAGEAIVESAKNAGDSEREIAKKQAAATVITSSVKAAIETAESIASFATGNIPGGIAHGLAAAAFIQAAVLAGGQKLPSAESPETGGGGGGTRSPGGGPRRSDTGDRDMTPIVVNIGSSGLVYAADRVQLGRDIDSMVSEARGRGGRGM